MTKDRVVAFRDPAGAAAARARPSSASRYCVASESCALDIIGAELPARRRSPARWSRSARTGCSTRQVVEGEREAFCVFEYIYFARPDSRMGGDVLQAARGRMGEILAREAPAPSADLVIAVPDSGNPAARGFARASGLPQDDGFVKNRYVARTFIQPGQELRKHGLRLKFNPLPEIVGGKRLVVVDDSIVRGNTTRQIVQMLRDAGAREVHMRISRAADQAPLPLRHRHVHARGDDRPRPHGRGGRRASSAATRSPTCRSPGVYEAIRGDRATATATPASRATTRSRAPTSAQGKFALELPLPCAGGRRPDLPRTSATLTERWRTATGVLRALGSAAPRIAGARCGRASQATVARVPDRSLPNAVVYDGRRAVVDALEEIARPLRAEPASGRGPSGCCPGDDELAAGLEARGHAGSTARRELMARRAGRARLALAPSRDWTSSRADWADRRRPQRRAPTACPDATFAASDRRAWRRDPAVRGR